MEFNGHALMMQCKGSNYLAIIVYTCTAEVEKCNIATAFPASLGCFVDWGVLKSDSE